MTFGENKKLFFSLIDEYNPNNEYFTDDDDARTKAASLYDLRYFDLASKKFNKKTKGYEITSEDRGFESFKLPKGTFIKVLGGRNEYNEPISMNFRIEGENLFISRETKGTLVVEYTPYPTHINEETTDDFELEIDDELASILPYGVAADLLKTDPGEDWTAFEKEYERRLANLITSRTTASVNITEGEF
jgi:hypothetical protein